MQTLQDIKNPNLSAADARILKLYINGKISSNNSLIRRLVKAGLIRKENSVYYLTMKARMYAQRWKTDQS